MDFETGFETDYEEPTKETYTDYKPLSVLEYIGYTLLAFIPLIGLIFMIIFACDKNPANICRKNFAKSRLYLYLILLICAILIVLFWILVIGAILKALRVI